jgi:hypothetical protein
MDTFVLIMFASVISTTTALSFIELRRIRKKLESKAEVAPAVKDLAAEFKSSFAVSEYVSATRLSAELPGKIPRPCEPRSGIPAEIWLRSVSSLPLFL